MSTNPRPTELIGQEKQDNGDLVDRMLSLYANGYSDIEVCKEIKISFKQFVEYCDNPGFKNIVDYGRDAAQAWWMTQGRTNLTNKEFVTELWKYNMTNRFGWASKSEAKRDITETVNIDKLKAELKDKMPELAMLLGEPLDQRKVVSESRKKH